MPLVPVSMPRSQNIYNYKIICKDPHSVTSVRADFMDFITEHFQPSVLNALEIMQPENGKKHIQCIADASTVVKITLPITIYKRSFRS